MAFLAIKLLGTFQVTLGGQAVTGFSTDKTRALLAYLTTESDRLHRRQALAGLLWPDYPERSARTSLRTALTNLRQVIGDRQAEPPFLLISRQTIEINRDSNIWADITALNLLLRTNQGSEPSITELEKASELYKGTFLKGFSLADSALFDEWILLKQEQTERQMIAALGRLTTSYVEKKDYQKALVYARRRVELDPWQEPAQRELIRLLAVTDRRAAALAHYQAIRRLLVEELGVEPESETTRLYEGIRDGQFQKIDTSPVTSFEIRPIVPYFLTEDVQVEIIKPVFVGREQELKVLHAHLRKAIDRQGQVLFVAGGAGRGKTVLIGEFVRQVLGKSPVVVATGYCNAYSGAGDPFLPFRQVLEMLTGDVDNMWAAGRITKEHAALLWETLPQTTQALVEVGPDLIGTFVDGPALVQRTIAAAGSNVAWLPQLRRLAKRKSHFPDPGDLEQLALIDQYVRVMARVAEHLPLLIILEDLHWADRGSIDILLHLERKLSGSPILIVCAYRPDEVAQGLEDGRHPIEDLVSELRSQQGEIMIDLAEQNPAASRHFLDELIDTEPNHLEEDFRRTLHDHTRGHPLFTVEMLRMMQQQGDLISGADGRWVEGQSLTWVSMPARVEAVIQKRIDRLDAELAEILFVASVEGEEFTAEVVERVLGIPKRGLLYTLSHILGRRHRLLQERHDLKSERQHISRFKFSHQLIQGYLYNNLGMGERRIVHEDVAKALEDLFANEIDEVTIQLAYHYSQADVTDKALHYLTQAGHQARGRYDGQQAVIYYSRALSLLPDNHPDRFYLLAARSAVNDILAHREAQRADIEAMEALAIHLGDGAYHCDALLALADYYLATEIFLARGPAQEALLIAREINDAIREAHALRRLAWAGRLGADFQTSLIYIEAAAAQFTEAAMPGEAADCFFMLARRLPGSGEHFFELEAAERAMVLSQEAADLRREAVAQKNLAIAYLSWGRFTEGLLLAEEALALQRQVGNRVEECFTLDVVGVILARLGHQEEAVAAFQQCLSLAEAIGSEWGVLGAVFGFWNYWYIPNLDYEGLLIFIDHRLNKLRTGGRDWLFGFLIWVKANILIESGQFVAAQALIEEVVFKAEEDDPVSQTLIILLRAEVQTRLARYDEAIQDLEMALNIAKKTSDRYMLSWPLIGLANVALIMGEQETLGIGLVQAELATELAREFREPKQLAEALDIHARLHLTLGQTQEADKISSELMDLVNSDPYLPRPRKYFYTHSLILRSTGRQKEANEYLQRAYERVMLGAAKFTDDSMCQCWLQNVPENEQIVNSYNIFVLGI